MDELWNIDGTPIPFNDERKKYSEHKEVPPLPTDAEISGPERRWAWVEVDLEAIRQNLKTFRRRLGPDVRIMAVVKGDGYGHGAVETAHAALSAGATWLGVANIDEGVRLRLAGIAAPILLLGEAPISAIPLLLRYQIVSTVYTMEFALALGEMADAQGRVAPYQLKIDTGMNRIGVHHTDAGDFLRTVSFHRGLELQGVFTHFATADEKDTYELKLQADRFTKALETIRYMGIEPGIVHAANSSAAIRFKPTHYDMVRLGLAMYGLHPSEVTRREIELRPAMSVHARVNYVKSVQVGEGVSYGFSYRSPGNVLIGTLPLGYADGISRALSNRMDVLIRGRRVPQVGAICMDMMMFEVNQRATARMPRLEIEVGDEVVLVGRSGDEVITLEELAHHLGTINYDLACRMGLRLPHVYVG